LKDIKCNLDNLSTAIDHPVLIELICFIYTKENPKQESFCEGKMECPINKFLRKVGFNHEILSACNEDLKDAASDLSVKVHGDMQDIPAIIS